jgi:hypothetical protein
MVYVDSRNLGYQPYVWRWLNSRTRPGEAEALRQLFDKYVTPAVDWVCDGVDGVDLVKRPKQSIPHTNLNMVAQLCDLLAATLVDHPKLQDPAVRRGGRTQWFGPAAAVPVLHGQYPYMPIVVWRTLDRPTGTTLTMVAAFMYPPCMLQA